MNFFSQKRDKNKTITPWIKDDVEYEPSQYTMWTGNGSRELVLEETYESQLLERIAKSSAGATVKARNRVRYRVQTAAKKIRKIRAIR